MRIFFDRVINKIAADKVKTDTPAEKVVIQKIKVGDMEYDEATLKSMIDKSSGADKKFLEAAKMRKESMRFFKMAKENPREFLAKTGLDPKLVDTVIMGTVISQLRTSNVAREAAFGAGIHSHTPCSTVTMACISANQAIASGVEKIMTGQADIVIAGGTDSTSDSPIQFNKPMRKKLFMAQKLKTPM